jgi:ribosomal protein S18 acetylase RimI-like enzyme
MSLIVLARVRIEPLDRKKHDRAAFTCGHKPLDNYLKNTAARQQDENMTRVRVGCLDDSHAVICFHALNAHALDISELDEPFRKRFQRYDHIPAIYLSMIAVHSDHQGNGIGRYMMADAMKQALEASKHVGAYFLVLDALNEKAVKLYSRLGFDELTSNPGRMIISFETIRRAVAAA